MFRLTTFYLIQKYHLRSSYQDIQRRVMGETASTISTKADRNWLENECEEVFQQELRKTAKNVTSLKLLAFTFPAVLPAHLRWFWVAKVMAIIPRFLMTGEIIMQEHFTYSNARQRIWRCPWRW